MNITFRINGKQQNVNLHEFSNRTTLNTYLRSHVGLTGTKYMCLEGSCGACLVSVRQKSPTTSFDQVLAIHSCLKLLYTCDGLELTTIEGIGNKTTGFHPIQKRLHEMHGTQCGYCTPGMIVNIFSELENNHYAMTGSEIEKCLVGNTCRCTGYRPILDAFKSFGWVDEENLQSNVQKCRIEDIEELPSCMPENRKNCILVCRSNKKSAILSEQQWFSANSVLEIFQIFAAYKSVPYSLVAGDTAKGVVKPPPGVEILIDISRIETLKKVKHSATELYIGGLVTIADAITVMKRASMTAGWEYCKPFAEHMELIANSAVRNVATIAGNLALKHTHPELALDIFLLLDVVCGDIDISNRFHMSERVTTKRFLEESLLERVILGVSLPQVSNPVIKTYRMALRQMDAFPYINAAFSFDLDERNCIKSCRICYGGIHPDLSRATATENRAKGNDLFTQATLKLILQSLDTELYPDDDQDKVSPIYRKNLALSLMYRFILNISPSYNVSPANLSGSEFLTRQLSFGSQTYSTNKSKWPFTQPILKYEGLLQCSGEANYCDDLVHQKNELWAAFAYATKVHYAVESIDASKALEVPGVRYFFSAKNIPGVNSIIPPYDGVIPEKLFLNIGDKVQFHGQPVGVLLADTMILANEAAEKVSVLYTFNRNESYTNVVSLMKRMVLGPENKIVVPTLEHNIPLQRRPANLPPNPCMESNTNITGSILWNGQYHFHMENQTTVVVPAERGYTVYCSSTWLDNAQIAMSQCLAVPDSYFYMPLARIGGSFGAKERRTMVVACAAALASHLTQLPVRFPMTVESNMRTIGKRIGALGDYSVEFDRSGHIQKLVGHLKHDVGMNANDVIVDVFKLTFPNVYDSRNWTYSEECVQTDSPTNTMFRAPGSLSAVAMAENIMEHIAYALGMDPVQVRLANIPADSQIRRMWTQFESSIDYEKRKQECNAFNAANRWKKRGLAVSMMSVPIVFLKGQPVFIAIYHNDGSVVISHGGIENGQGINTKAAQIVALALSIPLELVTIRPADNVISANAILTGASVSSEMVCFGLKKSCDILLERMRPVRDTMKTEYTWAELTHACYVKNIDLRQTYQFKETDYIPYSSKGLAAAEMEVDLLTGAYQCRRADILEDVGECMNPAVDVGQIEGAFVMGMGYWLTEQLIYDRTTGRLITNRAFTYKPPGVFDIPVDFRVTIWDKDLTPSMGIIRAKAVGEPPICLAVVTMFALRNALMSARSDAGLEPWFQMGTGNTPEKVFQYSGTDPTQFVL